MTSTIVTCHTCQLPTVERGAQPVRLLTPSGRYRDGRAVLKMGETVYECNDCLSTSARADEHIYVVHTCGITRTIGAATPQEAAVLMLLDRGWRSTRSVAVQTGNVWCEYLDCQIVDDALQYSERVDLP